MWPRRSGPPASPPPEGVDTADAHAFSTATRRTRVLRLVLAAAAVCLVVAAAASARNLDSHEHDLLPSGTTGVIVIDLSLSIDDADYIALGKVFRRLIAEHASIGLVVFSDGPYELLPPGTPAKELRPILRLLVPPALGPPVNPWTQTFRAGTRISTALDLAHGMLKRDGVTSGSILLVSDLETAPDDVPALTRTVLALRDSSIELRVIGFGPSSDARRIFEGLLGANTFNAPQATGQQLGLDNVATRHVPTALLLLGAVFFLVLAAHERFSGKLALTGRAQREP